MANTMGRDMFRMIAVKGIFMVKSKRKDTKRKKRGTVAFFVHTFKESNKVT
ncbi:MAG: hypothetical protein HBSAPP01_06560 [Candidatus Brocadia sapporoensis]|nr:MAG: hypothetical protein HBSAPP01_06560 [Candidatus Brocadia sapporoensis]